MSDSLEEKVSYIDDDLFGKLSTREKIIFDRASERAEILTMNLLIDYDSKNTTETWRTKMRNMLASKVDDYYRKYSN